MPSTRMSFQESLAKRVLESGRCVGCGACVTICPYNCLEYKGERPELARECKNCGICARVCPQYEWTPKEMDNFVFHHERKPEECFGVFRRVGAAQATDKGILEKAQDGGLVTTLLLFALHNGLIDGVVVSGTAEEKPFLPIPRVATTPKEILESAGTRYFFSTNILTLPETAGKLKALAFVGTPCQIRAIRKMQATGLKKNVANIRLMIGLMCSECFFYEGLMKEIQEKLGIRPAEIKKMNIKGKMLITTEQRTKTISLAEAKKYVRTGCGLCADFSSEFSDISAGGLGLDRWTLAIIRTEIGEDLFSKASRAGVIREAELNEGSLSLLCRLSAKKARSPQ